MSLYESSFVSDYEALAKLVQPDEAEVDRNAVSKPTPASIGPKELLDVKVPAPKTRKDGKDIWDSDEIADAVEDDVDDGREMPEYEFLYKQEVESTDVYLGMSGKNESSTCCDFLVVKINLPEVSTASELDLEVKATYIKLNHTRYKLSVYLPHKVNDEKGKARWDSNKHELSVTLPIIRDEEF